MKAIVRSQYGSPDVLELRDIDVAGEVEAVGKNAPEAAFAKKPVGLTIEEAAVLNELIEAGKVRPVIDRRNPLREVPEALRYLEAGHARGKVVIAVS